ncbi:MAG: formate dehydrogenase accessory sulfurtransferase FdhD [Actinobacteria bacterium]|nr:formate dehydrogenase accessory sulfurtransferase FdhD [Actinomycetota bacterium]
MAIMSTRRAITRVDAARVSAGPDELAVESPLVLGLDGEVLATLMRTPGHDIELAAGWLLVESGVARAEDIVTLRECRDDGTDRVHVTLRSGVARPRARAFVTSAACGVCSADVLDLDLLQVGPPHTAGLQLRPEVITTLPERMRLRQRTFDRTGGVHAAGLARAAGELLIVREDVGRHNAVDKVFGRALLDGVLPATDHLLVVSGRVSFEIVQKAMAAGVSGIVAVSAPSSLAVDLCRRYDLFLAGLVRGSRFNAYAGEGLLISPEPAAPVAAALC